jgi:dTDP-glucose pyrophosphorylase
MSSSDSKPLWVITAAGLGTRFRDAGYAENKEAVMLFERPLAWWALMGVRDLIAGCQIRLVVRQDGESDLWWNNIFSGVQLPEPEIIRLHRVTSGQAETVRLAISDAPAAQPLVVWNIDTLVRPDSLADAMAVGNWILCFPSDRPNLSYAEVNAGGTVLSVREKVVISPWATAGLYGFASIGLFERAYESTYVKGSAAGELFVAPMYEAVIREDVVKAWIVEAGWVLPLGTPSEVDAAAKVDWVARLAQYSPDAGARERAGEDGS